MVDYLAAIRPANASGPIHVNPSTGEPYVDIRKQWDRLVEIASRMLGYDLEEEGPVLQLPPHRRVTHRAARQNACTPPRPRTPRCLTVHRVFRYTDYPRGETVPFLRLSGRWLEQRGFGIGIQVYVEAAEGRLILTNYKTHMAELFGSSE